jgi:hypothetical protein
MSLLSVVDWGQGSESKVRHSKSTCTNQRQTISRFTNRRSGFSRFSQIILASGHLSNQIEDHLEKRTDIEHNIYRETKPLGTGGAIKFSERHFRSNPVLVMNGDSRIVYNFKNLLKTYFKQNCDALILLSQNTNVKDYDDFTMDNTGRICGFSEKPLNKLGSNFLNDSNMDDSSYQINLMYYSPDMINIKVKTNSDKILVVTNNYNKRWECQNNGIKIQILKTYGEFWGLLLQDKENHFICKYKSRSVFR